MSISARIALVALTALLGACASRPPPPPAPVARPVVFASPQPTSPEAEDVLFRALGLVGTPYRWGGNTPDSGFDCSGLIGYVYRDMAGINLPRSTREMIVMRAPNVPQDALQTGDLIFFATNGGSQVSRPVRPCPGHRRHGQAGQPVQGLLAARLPERQARTADRAPGTQSLV